jgi:hypothetical protein
MLKRSTLVRVPGAVAARIGSSWAESLEGCLQGDNDWAFLARYRCRVLLAQVANGVDRNSELKRRLRLWEVGDFDELFARIRGQQTETERTSKAHKPHQLQKDEESKRKAARRKTAAGAAGKATKSRRRNRRREQR